MKVTDSKPPVSQTAGVRPPSRIAATICARTGLRLRFSFGRVSGNNSTGRKTAQLMMPISVKTAAGSSESSSQPASAGPAM